MTKDEFEAWMKVTKSSETRWNYDQITHHNKGEYLFYKGGVNGVYIWIKKDGTASIGNYQGAIPHIMEAFFESKYTKKVGDNAETALVHVLSKLGIEFLLDFLGY